MIEDRKPETQPNLLLVVLQKVGVFLVFEYAYCSGDEQVTRIFGFLLILWGGTISAPLFFSHLQSFFFLSCFVLVLFMLSTHLTIT